MAALEIIRMARVAGLGNPLLRRGMRAVVRRRKEKSMHIRGDNHRADSATRVTLALGHVSWFSQIWKIARVELASKG